MSDQIQFRADVATVYQECQQAVRNQRAMRFALSGPLAQPMGWPCLHCSFVANGATATAITSAMDAHARYINAHGNRETDPHFEDVRMEALLSA